LDPPIGIHKVGCLQAKSDESKALKRRFQPLGVLGRIADQDGLIAGLARDAVIGERHCTNNQILNLASS
jgi:hypothetical protein